MDSFLSAPGSLKHPPNPPTGSLGSWFRKELDHSSLPHGFPYSFFSFYHWHFPSAAHPSSRTLIQFHDLALVRASYSGLLCSKPHREFRPNVFTCHFRLFAGVCGKRPVLLMPLLGTAAPPGCHVSPLRSPVAQVGNVILSYRNGQQPRRTESNLEGAD